MGVTQSREYAEPEWYVDLWLTMVWVVYLVIMAGTIVRRTGSRISTSRLWYYMAFILTIAVLHIVNNLGRSGFSSLVTKSYSAFAGVQDAMTQWWYGHNAVGFFLTAGFLGMMYYFLPKQADRPIWSYRLSIINFWALIFLYIWAGPHHLHFTALPEWAQIMGMTFTIMLWMPSWGSAVNGVMTGLGRLGQTPHRPGSAIYGRLGRVLRHEHARGPADGRPPSQRAQPLHRLDRRPRALWRPGLGRLH